MDKRQRLMLLGIAAAIVVVAIVIAISSSGGDKKDSSTSTAATAPAPGAGTGAEAQQQPEQINLKGGQPDGGVKKLSFKKNGPIDIVVTSDQKLPIHFHGYDVEKETAPGKPAEFKIAKANIDGVTEMEVESTSTKIASITVK